MNPYESPPFHPSGSPEGVPQQSRGLVNHVRIIAILMMVQAGLEVLMGLFLIVMAAVMPFVVMQGMQQNPGLQQEPLPPSAFRWILTATYGGMALVNLVAGGLHGYAGYRNYWFKSRVLGIVALAGGLATVLSCYCMPTALALAIYGLIVYLNGPVTAAFQMAEQGHPADTVIAAFNQFGGRL